MNESYTYVRCEDDKKGIKSQAYLRRTEEKPVNVISFPFNSVFFTRSGFNGVENFEPTIDDFICWPVCRFFLTA